MEVFSTGVLFLIVEVVPGLLNIPVSHALGIYLGDGSGIWLAAIIERAWTSPFVYGILAVMFLDLPALNKNTAKI